MLADGSENFGNICFKTYQLDPEKYLSAPGLPWQAALKKTRVKLDFLTDIHMLLTIEKGIRGGICHSIYWYAKANNKYKKDYDKNKECSHIQYWDVNTLYWWAISQKLPVNNFELIKRTSKINEESDEGYFLEVDVQYLKALHELHHDLPFLSKRMKIERVKNLVANLHDKTEYVIHIRNLKQASNHGLVLIKVYRVIKFDKNARPQRYINMKTGLRKKAKYDFEKDFFMLINNAVFRKTMENIRKHRDFKLVTTGKKGII